MREQDAKDFCRQLDSIDELVDEINTDGSAVISAPSDMADVLERMASKFGEIAGAAPTTELEAAFQAGHRMLSGTAAKLRKFPPDANVAEAARFSAEALAQVEDFGPVVLKFRREHCEADGAA